MNWADYTQAVFALLFVLGLAGLIVLILRRLGFGTGGPTIGQRDKRVRIVEVTGVDARRRLVLVRHDDREHLILLGMNGETIIESREAPPRGVLNDKTENAASVDAPPTFRQSLRRVAGIGRREGDPGEQKKDLG